MVITLGQFMRACVMHCVALVCELQPEGQALLMERSSACCWDVRAVRSCHVLGMCWLLQEARWQAGLRLVPGSGV